MSFTCKKKIYLLFQPDFEIGHPNNFFVNTSSRSQWTAKALSQPNDCHGEFIFYIKAVRAHLPTFFFSSSTVSHPLGLTSPTSISISIIKSIQPVIFTRMISFCFALLCIALHCILYDIWIHCICNTCMRMPRSPPPTPHRPTAKPMADRSICRALDLNQVQPSHYDIILTHCAVALFAILFSRVDVFQTGFPALMAMPIPQLIIFHAVGPLRRERLGSFHDDGILRESFSLTPT